MKTIKKAISGLVLTCCFLLFTFSSLSPAEFPPLNLMLAPAALQSDPAYESLKKAKELMYDDRYQQAIAAFKEITNKYPQSSFVAESYFWIAYSLEKEAKNDEKAFEANKFVVDSYPNSEWANDAKANMVKLAKKLYSQGKPRYKVYLQESGEDPDEDVKLAALTALGQLDSEEALPVLVDVLNSPKSSRNVKEKAIFAISQIGGAEAIKALQSAARNDAEPELQEKAIFWIGQEGGSQSLNTLLDIYKSTKNSQAKEKIIFAISQIGGEQALSILEGFAKDDANPDVQEKAIFWIGQEGSATSLSRLINIYKTTSNPKAGEHILFAASQVGSAEAVDFLIDVAKNESALDLRKKAIFWLGQSDSDKARDALVEIINQ